MGTDQQARQQIVGHAEQMEHRQKGQDGLSGPDRPFLVTLTDVPHDAVIVHHAFGIASGSRGEDDERDVGRRHRGSCCLQVVRRNAIGIGKEAVPRSRCVAGLVGDDDDILQVGKVRRLLDARAVESGQYGLQHRRIFNRP